MRKLTIFCLFVIFGFGHPRKGLAGEATYEPNAHQTATCSLCHRAGARIASTQGSGAENLCISCHQNPHENRISRASAQPAQQNCLRCHSFHDTGRVKTPGGELANDSPSMDSGYCFGCHNPEGDLSQVSAAHRAAADLYHAAGGELKAESPSESCLRCHASGSASAWQMQTAGRTLAFNPHASHPYGVMVVPGSGNTTDHIRWEPDRRLPLFAGRMECQSCHLLSAGTQYDLVKYDNPYDLCLGCHQHEAGPGSTENTDFMASMVRR